MKTVYLSRFLPLINKALEMFDDVKTFFVDLCLSNAPNYFNGLLCVDLLKMDLSVLNSSLVILENHRKLQQKRFFYKITYILDCL